MLHTLHTYERGPVSGLPVPVKAKLHLQGLLRISSTCAGRGWPSSGLGAQLHQQAPTETSQTHLEWQQLKALPDLNHIKHNG